MNITIVGLTECSACINYDRGRQPAVRKLLHAAPIPDTARRNTSTAFLARI